MKKGYDATKGKTPLKKGKKMVKKGYQIGKKKLVEGSAAEEKAESKKFEKKETK